VILPILALTMLVAAAAAFLHGILLPRIQGPSETRALEQYALLAEGLVGGGAALAFWITLQSRRRGNELRNQRLLHSLALVHRLTLVAAADEGGEPPEERLRALAEEWGLSGVGLWEFENGDYILRVGAGSLSGREGTLARSTFESGSRAAGMELPSPTTLELVQTDEASHGSLPEPAYFFVGPDAGPARSFRVSLHGIEGLVQEDLEGLRHLAELAVASMEQAEQRRRARLLEEGLDAFIGSDESPSRYESALAQWAGLHRWSAAEMWAQPVESAEPVRLAAWQATPKTTEFLREAAAPRQDESDPFPGWRERIKGAPHWQSGWEELSRFPRSRLAQEAGLRSALTLPLRAGEAELGALVFFGSRDDPPDAGVTESLQTAAGLVAVHLDRQARHRKSEQERRRAAEALEQVPWAAARWDRDGSILWCNAAELDLLGYPAEEYVGRHFSQFHADPDARLVLRSYLAEGEAHVHVESRLIRKDGTTRHVAMDLMPSSDSEGRQDVLVYTRDINAARERESSLLGTQEELELRLAERTQELIRINQEHLRDINRRIEAEREIAKTETRSRSLIQHIVDIVITLDVEAKITFASPSARRKLVQDEKELTGKSFYDFVHPDDLAAAMDGLTRMTGDPDRSHQFDLRLRRADGSWASIEAVGRSYLGDGDVTSIVMNLRDVTGRIQREQALRESEERFSLLVRSVRNYAIILLDADGRVASWNEGAARNSGYSPGEILGQNFSRFYTAEDVREGKPQRHLELALAEGRLMFQGWRVRKDETRYWAEVSITPLFDDQGQLRGYAKVTRDVSERKAAEERLRRSESLLSEAQRIAQIGSWEWDVRTDSVTWSDELYRIYGLIPAEYVPSYQGYLDRIHPYDREKASVSIQQTLTTGEPFADNRRIVHPDGEILWVHATGQIERDEQGAPLRMFGTCQDITERKRIEEALRIETELHLSMLNAQSELGEGVLLAEGDTIIYANPALEALFGLQAGPARSLRNLLDLTDLSQEAPLRQELELHSQQLSPPALGETTLKRRDGSIVHIGYIVSSVPGPDRVRIFSVFRDESERRHALEALQVSREQLRQYSSDLQRAREETSARISREIHDELGQTLTGLKLDLSWLAGHLPSILPEGADSVLEKTRGMTGLVDETIEQVRRIASELRPGVLDDLGLPAALEWQASEYESRFGIRCRVHCDEGTESVPPEHATAMFRIFQEALTNVARHAQAKTVDVTLRLEDASLRLTIADDGRGIADEDLRSTGSLGLLGMRERARLLGGETTLRRGGRKGTVIEVALPLPQASQGSETE
jgi:PAS domain S-box-containing protein